MRLWPSSALSICQYTDRHPVHLLHFLTVSASLLSTLKNEILFLRSACGYLIVRVSDSLSLGYGERKGVSSETAMTLCRLAECSVPMAGGGRGGVEVEGQQLTSRHRLCQHSKQTHFAARGIQAHIQPVRYLTLSAPISCKTEDEKRSEYRDKGLCSFTRKNKPAGDFVYCVSETD